ncbi:RUN domain protein [Aphelenchoides fujianensis]|nr:RUN domain protein [Aphelenchoides fujianensis]
MLQTSMDIALQHSKNAIRKKLDETIKAATSSASRRDDLQRMFSENTDQAVCNVIEAIFCHGLRDAFFLKGSRFLQIPRSRSNFWPFVSKFSPVYVRKQIASLKLIQSEIGKARAWIRIVLNEGALEQYISLIEKGRDAIEVSAFGSIAFIFFRLFTVPSSLPLAFLRDGEKVEALIGYLKALSRIPLDLATNSSCLNIWSPSPLILAGPDEADRPFPQHLNSKDDDDRSSVYSHPSLLDGVIDATHRPPANVLLASTPEESSLSTFRPKEAEISSEVVVKRRKGRIRRSSKSSSEGHSSSNISRDVSMTNIPEQVKDEAKAERNGRIRPKTPEKEESPPSLASDPPKAPPVEEEIVVEVLAKQKEFETVAFELTLPSDSERSADEPQNEEVDVEMPQPMSLHDELLMAEREGEGGQIAESFSGNNLQSRLWSAPSSFQEPERRYSTSSNGTDASGPPLVAFDSAMRSALRKDSALDETTASSSAQWTSMASLDDEDEVEAKQPEAVVIEDEEIDEYGIPRNVLKILTEIPQESGLDAQSFRCPSCKKSIGGSFSAFKLCNLDGRLYCEECFKKGDEVPIPCPNLVLNWEFPPPPHLPSVAGLLADDLRPAVDPNRRGEPPALRERARPREDPQTPTEALAHLHVPDELQARRWPEDLKRRFHPHNYLYSDIHLYSVKDLESIPTGVLERRLNIDFALSHVASCPLCLQKGFICELCKSNKLLYPFQIEIAHRCPDCFAVYHQKCMKESGECPKCKRRRRVNQAKEMNPLFA